MNRIYFDNAATTPLCPETMEVMFQAMQTIHGNPSSIHADGRRARTEIEKARKTIAKAIGASIGEIFFTSGGTESNNMALKCAVRDLGVERIISSPTEHHCNLHSLDSLRDQVSVQFVNVDDKGVVDMDHLAALLMAEDGKTLVSLMHANNEVGTMIDLEAVSELCEEYGALFHTDTVQTISYYPIDVSKTKISFLVGSAHKFHGPKGIGFIYVNGDNQIKPYLDGGGQERNMRAGTENLYGIIGMAKALSLGMEQMEERRTKIKAIQQYMATQIKTYFPEVSFLGDYGGSAQYKLLSISFPPSPKSELLLFNLDIEGISVSGGSACSSGADAGSHVVKAIKGDNGGGKMIRFSFNHDNTKEEVDRVISVLKKVVSDTPVGNIA